MATNISKLKATLNSSKTQKDNNALYQTVLGLITSLKEANDNFLPTAVFESFISGIRAITVIEFDSSGGPQTVALSDYINNNFFIFKDATGNASSNTITLTGTVDGVVNPTITTDYGVMRIYRSINSGDYLGW